MRGLVLGLVALILLGALGRVAEPAVDRLERFRELGQLLSDPGDGNHPIDAEAILAEMFSLADAEVVDNLRSGPPFASPAFIQERLEGFMATWGGASFRLHRVEVAAAPPGAFRKADASPVTLGVFTLPGSAPRGSVRAYGRNANGEIALLAATTREGVPEVHRWRAGRGGAAQFAATWLGPASGPGGRPLVIEIWRDDGRGAIDRVWSSAVPFPDGLSALGFSIKPGEITVRYEPRYPGWTPGCDGQTQHIDVYRPAPRGEGLVLSARRVVNAWHRDLHAAVARLTAALAAGDQAAVTTLVPGRAVRAALPRHLVPEPACDQAGPGSPPASATVAATQERAGRMVPWSLAWRRAPGGWQLSGADRVLQ